jgi:copper chaperone CopZ
MAAMKINKAFVEDRTVSVPGIHCERCDKVIHECLDDMAGLVEIEVNKDKKSVRFVYDSAQVGFDDIEKALSDGGYPVSDSRWTRFKVARYRFMDENARNNAQTTGGNCCSHPKGIYTKGHR